MSIDLKMQSMTQVNCHEYDNKLLEKTEPFFKPKPWDQMSVEVDNLIRDKHKFEEQIKCLNDEVADLKCLKDELADLKEQTKCLNDEVTGLKKVNQKLIEDQNELKVTCAEKQATIDALEEKFSSFRACEKKKIESLESALKEQKLRQLEQKDVIDELRNQVKNNDHEARNFRREVCEQIRKITDASHLQYQLYINCMQAQERHAWEEIGLMFANVLSLQNQFVESNECAVASITECMRQMRSNNVPSTAGTRADSDQSNPAIDLHRYPECVTHPHRQMQAHTSVCTESYCASSSDMSGERDDMGRHSGRIDSSRDMGDIWRIRHETQPKTRVQSDAMHAHRYLEESDSPKNGDTIPKTVDPVRRDAAALSEHQFGNDMAGIGYQLTDVIADRGSHVSDVTTRTGYESVSSDFDPGDHSSQLSDYGCTDPDGRRRTTALRGAVTMRKRDNFYDRGPRRKHSMGDVIRSGALQRRHVPVVYPTKINRATTPDASTIYNRSLTNDSREEADFAQ